MPVLTPRLARPAVSRLALLATLALVHPLPAVDYFWNLGTNGTWGDGSRWGPVAGFPTGAGNTAEIFVSTAPGHAGGPIFGVTVDGDYTIDAFTHISDGGNLLATGRTLTVSGTTLFDGYQITLNTSNYVTGGVFNHDSGHLDMVSSSLNGVGSYDKDGGTVNLTGSTINVIGSQSAGSMTLFGTNTFGGGFDSTAGSLTLDQGVTLNINNGNLTSGGTLDILGGNSNTTLQTSTSQSLINSPGGIVNVNGGGTGTRRFVLDVDNQGTLNLNTTAEFDNSGGVHANSGTLNATASRLLVENARSFTNSGSLLNTGGSVDPYVFLFFGDLNAASFLDNSGTITTENGLYFYYFENLTNSGTINVDGGNAFFRLAYFSNVHQFDNSGDIVVAPGAQAIFDTWNNGGSGSVTLQPGSTLGGGGNIRFNIQTVDIQGAWNPGASALVPTSTSLNGAGTLTITNGSTLTATNSHFNVQTDNHGTATFLPGTVSTHGAFTNKVDGSVTLDGTNTQNLRINDNDFINEGAFTVDPGTTATRIYENDSGSLGFFRNTGTGVVTVNGTGSRRFELSVDNQATFNLNTTTEFDNSGGVHSNSGTINANASSLLVESARSFTNSGSLLNTGGSTDPYVFQFFGDLNAASFLDNSGTITTENGLYFYFFENQSNSGTINVDGGNAFFRLSYFSNPNQFVNSGDIVVAPGAQAIFDTWNNGGSGSVTLQPGSTLGGGGNVRFTTQTVDIQGAWNPGASALVPTSTSLNGAGTLTITNGSVLSATNSNFNVQTDNHGTATFMPGTVTTHGAFTNKPDGSLTLDGTNTQNLRINDNDFVNEGAFTVDPGTTATRIYELDSGSLGFFRNTGTGIVTVNGTGSRRFELSVDNQATFDLNATTEFDNSSGFHTNSGTINANASRLLVENARSFTNSGNLLNTGGSVDPYVFQFFGDQNVDSFVDNSGTITTENGLYFYFFENQSNSGTINVDGGNAFFRLSYFSNVNQFVNSGDIVVAPGAQAIFDTWNNGGSGSVTLQPGSTLGGGGNIQFNTQTVDIQGTWNPGTSKVFASSSSLNGAGLLTIANGNMLTSTNSNFGVTVNNLGDTSVSGTGNTANGAFTVNAGGTFTLADGAGFRINDSDFTNEGALTLAAGTGSSYFHELDSGSLGSFVNASTGTVLVEGTGSRRFTNSVDNQGLFNLNTVTEFDNNGGVHSNSGTINAAGKLLVESAESFANSGTLTSTGGNLTIFGNVSGTSSLDNSGTITVENGSFFYQFTSQSNSGLIDINNGTSTFYTSYFSTPTPFTNSGDIDVAPGAAATFTRQNSGTGSLVLQPGSTLDGGGTINITLTTTDVQGAWSIGDSTLNTSSASVNGVGTLTIGPMGALNSTNSNFGATVDNHGTASFNSTGNTTNGAFTNKADGTFTLEDGARLRINDNDFTNEGPLTFATGTGSSYFYELDGGSLGSFVNTSTGTVTIEGTGSRRFNNSVDNQGVFNLNTATEFDNNGGVHSNSGTINASGQLLVESAESFTNSGNLTSTGGNLTIFGNVSGTSFLDNSGTITVENGSFFYQFSSQSNSGLIDINNGTSTFYTSYFSTPTPFTNSGDIDVAPGAVATFTRQNSGVGSLVLQPGSTLDGGGTINITLTTTDVQGAWSIGSSTLNVSSASINGAGTLTIDPSGTLNSTSSNFGATVDNHGIASCTGTGNTSNGAFTNKADGTFTLENASRLRINDNDFTNEGILTFAAGTGSSYFYELDSGSLGSFVNTPTGTVTVEGTGSRRFNNSVDNQGILNLNTTTEFDNGGGVHSNSGTINAAGQLLVESAESFTNSGDLTSTGGNLTLFGNVSGTSFLDNSGTITIENGSSFYQFNSQTNSGLIDINNGTAIFYTSYFTTPTPFTNSGVIDIAPGATATFSRLNSGTGVATNEIDGRIIGSGTLNVTLTNFTNHGTIAPGNSTGILTIGAMTHSASSVFEMEVGNTSGPGTGHDQIVVNGNLALNGTLKPRLLPGFVPAPTDVFTIMTATGDITGNFAAIDQPESFGTWSVNVDEVNDIVTLSFTQSGPLTYADFQGIYFTPTQIANLDASKTNDFDGDGIINFLEWIYGFDPTDAFIPVSPVSIARNGAFIELTYPESTLLPAGEPVVEVLTTLDLQFPFPTIPAGDYTRLPEVPLPGHPNIQMVTLRVTNPAWSSDPGRFFQLRFLGLFEL